MRIWLLALLGTVQFAHAADGSQWCAGLQAQPHAPYLVRMADGHWQLLARRPSAEAPRAALASAKASLAQHLNGGRDQSVIWSGATAQGPYRCNGFNAMLLTVPAATVQLAAPPVAPLAIDDDEATRLLERRHNGTATAAELLRLAGFYQLAGDSGQAAVLAEQAANIK